MGMAQGWKIYSLLLTLIRAVLQQIWFGQIQFDLYIIINTFFCIIRIVSVMYRTSAIPGIYPLFGTSPKVSLCRYSRGSGDRITETKSVNEQSVNYGMNWQTTTAFRILIVLAVCRPSDS